MEMVFLVDFAVRCLGGVIGCCLLCGGWWLSCKLVQWLVGGLHCWIVFVNFLMDLIVMSLFFVGVGFYVFLGWFGRVYFSLYWRPLFSLVWWFNGRVRFSFLNLN